jgi:SAM-dependent methyltransferase
LADPGSIEQRVASHYAQVQLEKKILDLLAADGKDIEHLTLADLAPVDEFHTGGREATVAFAAELGFTPEMHILDVGCGIGGPSRYIAETYGCRVTGIDLTEEFVRTAQALARRTGLETLVDYRQASALDIPFAPGTFDGAYMMHVGMNIEDKPALFAEVRRVLKDNATFGIYDVMLTEQGEPRFPLPFAQTAETSFLATLADYRRALHEDGFVIERGHNRLEAARAYFRERAARAAEGEAPVLSLHLLLKGEGPAMFANVVSLYEEGVLAPVELICRARVEGEV